MVTPRVEASPDRSDFTRLGETIALEHTKQFADNIRSQIASRELAEMNERLMAFGDLAAPGRHPCISFGRPKRLSTGSPASLKG